MFIPIVGGTAILLILSILTTFYTDRAIKRILYALFALVGVIIFIHDRNVWETLTYVGIIIVGTIIGKFLEKKYSS